MSGRYFAVRPGSRLAGHGLIELLIAMALGVLATLATVSLYRGQREAVMRAADTARLTSEGIAALDLIAQHARMTGFAPAGTVASAASAASAVAPVFGCSAGFPTGTGAAVSCAPDQSGSDGIALRYVADTISTWPSAEGNPTDCLGHNIHEDARGAWIENRFYISAASAAARPELYCRSTASVHSVKQPVVEAVERLQIRYWLRGAAAPIPAYAVAPQQWQHVVALDLCVVVRGARAGTPARYLDCAGASVAAPDGHRRRAFASRVALRNMVGRPGDE